MRISMNKEALKRMKKGKENVNELRKEDVKENEDDKKNIFFIDEIQIEEMAIDGICGVY